MNLYDILNRLLGGVYFYYMKNISLQRECNADHTDIFFIDIKTQFTEIFGENIGNYFEKY